MGVLLVMQCLVTAGRVTKGDNLHCGLWKIFGWCDPRMDIAPFLLSVSISDWSTNIIPKRPQE